MPSSETPTSRQAGTLGQITELLEGIRQGRPAAENALMEEVQGRLRRLAQKMLHRSPAVARWEQTDDVFSELWMQLRPVLLAESIRDRRHFFRLATLRMNRLLCDLARRYRGPESFAAHHATGVSATQAEALVRSHQRRGNPSLSPPEQHGVSRRPTPSQFMGNPQPGPVTAVILKDDHFLIHETLSGLAEEDFEILGLIYYQELTQAEAAELLNVDERTVRRRLARAYRCMGQLLGARRGRSRESR